MKKILLHQRGMKQNNLFDPAVRDYSNDPYIRLRARMLDLGYELNTIDDRPVGDADRVLFFDASSVYPPRLQEYLVGRLTNQNIQLRGRDIYGECLAGRMEDRMALFLWEGSVISPLNWRQELHAKFSTIFTWNDHYVDGNKFHKLHWPQPTRFGAVTAKPFHDKKLLVNISMNKYSSRPHELYSARRRSIRYFERSQPDQFDLYGVGWDKSLSLRGRVQSIGAAPYSSYRGTVGRKSDVFPNYRFALCYENIRGAPGYITEKIFDCMRADCVPIYWGASNVGTYIPAECFIDRTLFGSDAELERYLLSISDTDYAQYRRAIDDFLSGSAFAAFGEDAFCDQVIRVLRLA